MRRNWTSEEIEYLCENWGVISIPAICKNLNRSKYSIQNKVQRLGLGGHTDGGELITFSKLIKALGFNNSYTLLRDKYTSAGLKIIYKTINTKKIAKVDLKEFWKWAEKNKGILNFSKFEKGMLGSEPNWVNEKRQADKINPTKHDHNRPWTKEDDNRLISKTKSCRYTYKDLSKELNRTENAIKRRLYDLGVPYRPLPLNNHIKWTKEENEKMVELYKKGYDTYAIATALNKTQLSISDRLKSIGY